MTTYVIILQDLNISASEWSQDTRTKGKVEAIIERDSAGYVSEVRSTHLMMETRNIRSMPRFSR